MSGEPIEGFAFPGEKIQGTQDLFDKTQAASDIPACRPSIALSNHVDMPVSTDEVAMDLSCNTNAREDIQIENYGFCWVSEIHMETGSSESHSISPPISCQSNGGSKREAIADLEPLISSCSKNHDSNVNAQSTLQSTITPQPQSRAARSRGFKAPNKQTSKPSSTQVSGALDLDMTSQRFEEAIQDTNNMLNQKTQYAMALSNIICLTPILI
ncbi:hypothetical protein QAD02_014501 [Eretmocerus hayati]|uniref:Uncharacterized protein n=1 Tax=Eretmocerus hayati TaxID=131215 RepID=A0ACC2P556_9HYME|nr:hypothetical protein QAD02_014501 [Eretmocerus hayati]